MGNEVTENRRKSHYGELHSYDCYCNGNKSLRMNDRMEWTDKIKVLKLYEGNAELMYATGTITLKKGKPGMISLQ
jgi:hypothetical protein